MKKSKPAKSFPVKAEPVDAGFPDVFGGMLRSIRDQLQVQALNDETRRMVEMKAKAREAARGKVQSFPGKEPAPIGDTAQKVADEILKHLGGISLKVLAENVGLSEDVVKQAFRRSLRPLGFRSVKGKGYLPPR